MYLTVELFAHNMFSRWSKVGPQQSLPSLYAHVVHQQKVSLLLLPLNLSWPCDLLWWIEGGQNDAGSVLGLALQRRDRFFFCCVGSWLPWEKSCCSTGELAPASSPVGKWLAQDQLASWTISRSPGSLSSALSTCYHWSAGQSNCSSSHGWCNLTH